MNDKELIDALNSAGDSGRCPQATCYEAAERIKRLREALQRIGDRRMWRDDTRGLVWEGETRDGNEIETADPRDIASDALKVPR